MHAMAAADAAARLDVDPSRGLSPADAARRRRQVGSNRMPQPAQPSFARLLAQQLVNAPTALLGGGAAISVFSGGVLEAALILTVGGANACSAVSWPSPP